MIRGSAKSRTVVIMENFINISSATARGTLDQRFPVDLHVFASDGKHVGPDYSTNGYALEINDSRAGGYHTSYQWISFPTM